jgi:hypothetical protein
VAREDLTPEEAHVLDYAGDEFGAFTLLAWLGSNEHQPERAAAIAERLLERGLVEIEEHRPSERRRSPKRPRELHILSRDEALRAIRDPRKWRDPEEEPFRDGEPYYEAHATEAGIALLRQRGWTPS